MAGPACIYCGGCPTNIMWFYNMKARIFKQMSLQEFVKIFPDKAKYLPVCIDLNDTDYVVRYVPGTSVLEIGYISDRWTIK